MIAPSSTSSFRLVRYFTATSFAAFLLVTAPLMYLVRAGNDFFDQVLLEQSRYFKQVQDGFGKQQDESARRDLLAMYEAANVNLSRMLANVMWDNSFAPFVAKAQQIPVDRCRAIADVKDAGGKTVQPDEKRVCFAEIGKKILALPGFKSLEARVFETMQKSTVFKIKVYDLRGITVYSSEHNQIGQDKLGNAGWQNAVAGKPASSLTHRGKFSAFEGVVENRDLIESYVSVLARGGENVVGVFEIYSDVTSFLDQIKYTSAQIQKLSAENHAQLERAVAANAARADKNANLLLAVVLVLLVLLYCALFLIVRNGQRIIDREKVERERAEQALGASEARFRSLTELSSDWYWEQDRELRMSFHSGGFAKGAGTTSSKLLGKRRWEEPNRFPLRGTWDEHRATLEAHEPFRDFEYLRVGDSGERYFVALSGVPIYDAAGEFIGYRGIGRNITERKLAEADLRIAATAFEAQEGMLVTDASSVILRVNRAFTEITGYSAAEVVGQTPRLLRSGRHNATFYRGMWESILGSGTWKGEIWNRRKSGEVYPEWLTITAVKDGDGSVANYVATLTDITHRKAADDEIRNLAFYDPLTQLPNRRLLMDRLHQALASSERSRRPGALLFIDLDHFKTLNDTLGHDKGDLLLQQVAQRLATCVRASDTVARLGGDEFVVMLEDLSENGEEAAAQTRTIGEKILATFATPYLLAGHQHESSGSIGITPFCGHNEAAGVLLKHADIAMYQAKAAGRNALRFFDPGMHLQQ